MVQVTASERLLTADQVADILGIPIATLYNWRYKGSGPPAIKIGHRTLRFRHEDLEIWIADHREDPV